MKRFTASFLSLLMVLALSAAAFAQATTGRLIGSVADASGAVAGATVTIIDNQTKRERTTVTD